MREVLGLSLTASTVAYTLVDLTDGTIVAEDVAETDSSQNVATAAADTVEALTSPTGRTIDAVRIAWSEGAAGSAVTLNAKLRSLGFSDVDVISEGEARHSRNRTARYIDPPLELAYGAARIVSAERHDRPLLRMPARRVSLAAVSSVVALAVGAAAAGYLLVGRAPSHAVEQPAPSVASSPPSVNAVLAAAPAAPLPAPPPEADIDPPVALAPLPAPPPEADIDPPVALAPSPAEAAAPVVTEEPQVAAPAALPDTEATPAQAATTAREPLLAAEAPAAEAPEAEPAPIPEVAPLPHTAPAPLAGPLVTWAGQTHLTPEALSARLLPGPVPPMPLPGAPAPPVAPPPASNPYDILAGLP